MTVATDAIGDFWKAFAQWQTSLAAAESADCPAYDELLACLHRVDQRLWIEFSANAQPHELIITADGNREAFPTARAVVDAAPPIEGWKILALKPKLGFPTTARWEGYTLQVNEAFFEPLERNDSDALGLRVLVPKLEAQDAADAHSAVIRALDHGLGEQGFAEEIEHVEVQPLPDDKTGRAFIALVDLETFLQWRNR
jgi:hypothetical protein